MTNEEFRELFLKLYGRIVRYLRTLGLSEDEAKDTAQEAFLRVLTYVTRNPHAVIDDIQRYLWTAAHNQAMNRIRRRITHRPHEGDSLDAIPNLEQVLLRDFWNDQPPASPEAQAIHNEQVAKLRAAIEQLSDKQKETVLLRLRGLEYVEIARVLGISEETVKTRLRDAKRRLCVLVGREVNDGDEK